MKEKHFKHSKKRNSILLYEFLIRHISKCLLEDKKDEANKTLLISKKFFSEGSPLRAELKLFQSVLSSNVKSKDAAFKIVEYACKSAALMNSRMLDEQKSKLIKEINYNLNQDVYNYKVPNYTTCASLQVLFNDSRERKQKINEIDKIKLKDNIVSVLSENKKVEQVKVNPTYNNAVYSIIVNKFNEKYKNKLTENQKKVVLQYTTFLISENKNEFMNFLKNESNRVFSKIVNIKDKQILEDKELTKRLKECAENYKEIIKKPINEEFIVEFLKYVQLVDEIEA